jgi:endonuclease III
MSHTSSESIGGSDKRSRTRAQKSQIGWAALLNRLTKFYSVGTWRTPVLRDRGADPFSVLVSTVISHRTRDEFTLVASRRLLSKFPSPISMSRANVGEIESLIWEAGLSHQKATGLKFASQEIVERFGGKVPESEEELTSLPLVGPKTAHAVRVFAFEKPGIPVDSHILRVSRRLGFVRGTTIASAQRELAAIVPRRLWIRLNPVLVQHGQNVCLPRQPRCGACPIEKDCQQVGI